MFERDKTGPGSPGDASLIDADMRITGTVISSGDIVLAGQLDGEIKCRTLVVEDEAVLTGTVNATETIVSGNLNGEVTSDVLRIKGTGVFDGAIKAKSVEVEKGASVKARFRKVRR